jgi:hypothetical protein
VVVDELGAKVNTDCGDSTAGLPGGSTPEGGAPSETIGRERVFRARLREWLLGEQPQEFLTYSYWPTPTGHNAAEIPVLRKS